HPQHEVGAARPVLVLPAPVLAAPGPQVLRVRQVDERGEPRIRDQHDVPPAAPVPPLRPTPQNARLPAHTHLPPPPPPPPPPAHAPRTAPSPPPPSPRLHRNAHRVGELPRVIVAEGRSGLHDVRRTQRRAWAARRRGPPEGRRWGRATAMRPRQPATRPNRSR